MKVGYVFLVLSLSLASLCVSDAMRSTPMVYSDEQRNDFEVRCQSMRFAEAYGSIARLNDRNLKDEDFLNILKEAMGLFQDFLNFVRRMEEDERLQFAPVEGEIYKKVIVCLSDFQEAYALRLSQMSSNEAINLKSRLQSIDML